jgi:hypothetical protein
MRCALRPASIKTRTARAGPRSASWPCRSAFTSTLAALLPDTSIGPPSCIVAARASSSAGCKALSVADTFQRSRLQRPLPVMRPAACDVVPSSASKRRSSSSAALSGRPPSASVKRRSGKRCSFQRPAAALFISMSTVAG